MNSEDVERLFSGLLENARKDIAGELAKPVRYLRCCCCGEGTRGRQWHNRDTGYGLCESCADNPRFNWTESDQGFRGIHYAVKEE